MKKIETVKKEEILVAVNGRELEIIKDALEFAHGEYKNWPFRSEAIELIMEIRKLVKVSAE